MKEASRNFFSIVLIGLLLIKISAFHVYEHHDVLDSSNTNCELCILTIEGQQFEGISPFSSIIYQAPIQIISRPETLFDGEDYIDSFEEGILFSRPPPTCLS